jgi:hypothetical protein
MAGASCRAHGKTSQVPRKQFFFEKKNQKTFVRFSACQSYQPRQPTEQKFFVSFFQKRDASFLA